MKQASPPPVHWPRGAPQQRPAAAPAVQPRALTRTLQRAMPARPAPPPVPPAARLRQGRTIQPFVLSDLYRPRTNNVPGQVLDELTHKPIGNDTLDGTRSYRATGFDFQGNVVLWDEQYGIRYSVSGQTLGQFDGFVGFPDVFAQQWQPQRHKKGCWLAAMAVVAGLTQDHIQTTLGWGDDAFYSITMKELPEFGQMIGCRVQQIEHTSIDALFAVVRQRRAVILGVPNHVLVLYAISHDRTAFCLWDPNGGKLKVWGWQEFQQFVDCAYCKA